MTDQEYEKSLKPDGEGWSDIEDKYRWYYTEKVKDNFYYYVGVFYP